MKKLFVIGSLLLITSQAFSYVIVKKDRWRLFGYKQVHQTNGNDGSITLLCNDGGWTRCAPVARVINNDDDKTEISVETMEKIDEVVMKSVTEDNTTGKLIFDNAFFVTYEYNVHQDKLVYIIYTLAEAKKKGIL